MYTVLFQNNYFEVHFLLLVIPKKFILGWGHYLSLFQVHSVIPEW